jgi:ATP/maltotriose-dependent transcriptional regulator MalT
MYAQVDAEKTLYRYRQLIRTYLDITPYGEGGQDVVETAVQHAASTMSDPADLINVAVEHLCFVRKVVLAQSS